MNATTCMESILPCRNTPVLVADAPFKTEIVQSINHILPDVWQHAIAEKGNPFMQYNYLKAVEESHAQKMRFRYALFTHCGQPIGAACFQLFTVAGNEALKKPTAISELHTENNTAAPASLRNRAKHKLQQILHNSISKMRVNMLVCGNALLTAECGVLFKPQCPPQQGFELLNHTINQIKREEAALGNPVQLIMVKDFLPHHAPDARRLLQYRFRELHFQPNMVLTLPPHWNCFDDYLQAMSSKYRVRTKRVLTKGNNLQMKDLTADEINLFLPDVYRFYTDVSESVDFNLFTATPEYFTSLKTQMPQLFFMRGCFLHNQIEGFMCAFVINKHMEVHFTGYNHRLNKDFAIYSNMLYDMVCLGLQQGVHTISFGRTALEIKSTIGAEAVNMPAFVKHTGFFMNSIIAPLINQFNQTHWTPRHPFKQETEPVS